MQTRRIKRLGILSFVLLSTSGCGAKKINIEADLDQYKINKQGQLAISITSDFTKAAYEEQLSDEQSKAIYNPYTKTINPDYKLKVALNKDNPDSLDLTQLKDEQKVKYQLSYNKDAYRKIGIKLIDHGSIELEQAKVKQAVKENINVLEEQVATNKSKIETKKGNNDEIYAENQKQIKHVQDKITSYEQLKNENGDPDGTLSLYIKDYQGLLKKLKANPKSNLQFNQVVDLSNEIEKNEEQISKLKQTNEQLAKQITQAQIYLNK